MGEQYDKLLGQVKLRLLELLRRPEVPATGDKLHMSSWSERIYSYKDI